MSNSYPRETVEFAPITIEEAGAPITSGVTFAVVADNTRPTVFTAATTLSGKIGVMVSGLAPGTYRVWAKIASAPETPVIDCGVLYVT